MLRDFQDGRFKVMVNYVKRGVTLTSPTLANNEASRIKVDEMPHASISLVKIGNK